MGRRVVDDQQAARAQHALDVRPPAGILRTLGVEEQEIDAALRGTRFAFIAFTSTARSSPVSRVMLSIRRGRSVIVASFCFPNSSSSASSAANDSVTRCYTFISRM
jgi:hypothetical protein